MPPPIARIGRLKDSEWSQTLAGSILATIPATTPGSWWPIEPSSVKERSKPLGPVIFISQRSLPADPSITTRQSPGRSARTCSIIATRSLCIAASPVLCVSTVTAIAKVYDIVDACCFKQARICCEFFAEGPSTKVISRCEPCTSIIKELCSTTIFGVGNVSFEMDCSFRAVDDGGRCLCCRQTDRADL